MPPEPVGPRPARLAMAALVAAAAIPLAFALEQTRTKNQVCEALRETMTSVVARQVGEPGRRAQDVAKEADAGWRPSITSAARPPARKGRSARACCGWSRAGARPSRPTTPAGGRPPGPACRPGNANARPEAVFTHDGAALASPSAPTARPS